MSNPLSVPTYQTLVKRLAAVPNENQRQQIIKAGNLRNANKPKPKPNNPWANTATIPMYNGAVSDKTNQQHIPATDVNELEALGKVFGGAVSPIVNTVNEKVQSIIDNVLAPPVNLAGKGYTALDNISQEQLGMSIDDWSIALQAAGVPAITPTNFGQGVMGSVDDVGRLGGKLLSYLKNSNGRGGIRKVGTVSDDFAGMVPQTEQGLKDSWLAGMNDPTLAYEESVQSYIDNVVSEMSNLPDTPTPRHRDINSLMDKFYRELNSVRYSKDEAQYFARYPQFNPAKGGTKPDIAWEDVESMKPYDYDLFESLVDTDIGDAVNFFNGTLDISSYGTHNHDYNVAYLASERPFGTMPEFDFSPQPTHSQFRELALKHNPNADDEISKAFNNSQDWVIGADGKAYSKVETPEDFEFLNNHISSMDKDEYAKALNSDAFTDTVNRILERDNKSNGKVSIGKGSIFRGKVHIPITYAPLDGKLPQTNDAVFSFKPGKMVGIDSMENVDKGIRIRQDAKIPGLLAEDTTMNQMLNRRYTGGGTGLYDAINAGLKDQSLGFLFDGRSGKMASSEGFWNSVYDRGKGFSWIDFDDPQVRGGMNTLAPIGAGSAFEEILRRNNGER